MIILIVLTCRECWAQQTYSGKDYAAVKAKIDAAGWSFEEGYYRCLACREPTPAV